MNQDDFYGTYYIKRLSGVPDSFSWQTGDIVRIGASKNPGRSELLHSPRSGSGTSDYPIEFDAADCCFRCQFGAPAVEWQMSLFKGEGGYRALYGITLRGDPDPVGVWGADNNEGPEPRGGLLQRLRSLFGWA